jgi:MFS family permease
VVPETGAAQPSGRSALEELDSRTPTSFYWYLAGLACIGGFCSDTARPTSARAELYSLPLVQLRDSYLVAGASLGAAAGALVAGPTTDRFGRKSLLIVDAAICEIGAILSAVTVDALMLLASRTLIGPAIGADSAIAPRISPSSRHAAGVAS